MLNSLTRGLLAALPAALVLAACQPATPHAETINQLQAEALESELAWELLTSLTTDVGPRMPGTRGDALGVAWAEAQFERLGFDRVRKEKVTFPLWRRGFEQARVVLPRVQDFAVTALGGSPGTEGIVSAEVVHFPDLAALEAAAPGSLEGKIAFISTRMERSRSGRDYSRVVAGRSQGPFVAAEKGAEALVIRSVGTDNDRLPHIEGCQRPKHFEPGARITKIPLPVVRPRKIASANQQLWRHLIDANDLQPKPFKVCDNATQNGIVTTHPDKPQDSWDSPKETKVWLDGGKIRAPDATSDDHLTATRILKRRDYLTDLPPVDPGGIRP